MRRATTPTLLLLGLLSACGGGTADPSPEPGPIAPAAPTANAGPDRQAVTGQTLVQIDGSASSDPGGLVLTFAWQVVSVPPGSVAVLDATTRPSQPTFTPDKSGTYVFRLQVNNGVSVSGWDQVTVTSGAQDAIALVSGTAQTAVVAHALPQPVVFRVTNAYGMPVKNVWVAFSTASGAGALSPTGGYTDSAGEVRTTLTARTIAGAEKVIATASTCATTPTAEAGATLLADVPVSVVPVVPADAHLGATMTLRVTVLDAYGNVATGDASTQFTVTASGTAMIAAATQGTLLAGAGTGSVLVQVIDGEAVLSVTDTVAEQVTFAVVDSERNGLAYPGNKFQATASQALSCSSSYVNTFSFDVSKAKPPAADATITVRANGHYDSNYLEILLETATGTSYGKLLDAAGSFCIQLNKPVTVPLAALQTYVADGKVGVVTRSSWYPCIFCSAAYSVELELSYPTLTQAEFY